MASTQDYLEFILDLLVEIPELAHRKMMGECLLYSDGVLFGGTHDERFLLKDVPASREAFPSEEAPYEGAKPMLLIDSEDPTLVATVIESMPPRLKYRRTK